MKMAVKRRRNYRKNRVKYTSVRRMFLAFMWLAMVLLLLFFVGRYFLNDISSAFNDTKKCEFSNLEDVSLKPGMEIIKLEYKGYSSFFNSSYHIPNCVSYELTRSETSGDVPRYKNFEPAPDLVGTAYPSDYIRSGYDRGHMAPAADMKWDKDAMHHSFYMSNICPQSKSLNTGIWHKLENRCRDWAIRDSALIVVCGPVLSDNMERIGETGVAVPKRFFKVILAPYVQFPRAIGFIFDNTNCSGKLKKYAVSVDSIETITGYDFFYNLPDEIENKVEAMCNFQEWNNR